MCAWTPDSWRDKAAAQAVQYPDQGALRGVRDQIAKLPPLVTSWEVDTLRKDLARVERGEALLLQGGDCAESFEQCRPDPIASVLKVLLQMSVLMIHRTHLPVVRVGRLGGQYAKPRSAELETRGETILPVYRGDLINRPGFSGAERTPDPDLMLQGYQRAGLTMNFIRALTDGGFADLHYPENWRLPSAGSSEFTQTYERVIRGIEESIAFMEAIDGTRGAALSRVDFFTSHEALALEYEVAQTRHVARCDGWYNLSTHLPWIGLRTAQPDGAHVEYCRGLRNPIAVKIGPGTTPELVTELLDILHPDGEPGRLTLIHRMGHERVEDALPPLIEAVQRSGKKVVFCADPMHGNTESTSSGLKTRRFDRILAELEICLDVHQRMGTRLGGVHLELTGEDVTECVGGAGGLEEADLERAYRSPVDPRLNREQALELAMRLADHIAQRRLPTQIAPIESLW